MNRKDDNLLRKLGKQIKVERTKKDLTQEKLAELAKLTMLTIGSIENGKSAPTIITLSKIAEALDIKLCDLLDFE
ncbi:MAG: helix-turn-helix transcriptional regulator [Brachyspira sp.]|uniref:Helix-turn-helix transcriptional regulator n=1 Tax=Candidatus Scatousia excrementigallinarum TaxID=2840935 RepID=A0A9D1JP09_9BACT|nr:helix-turn-helix transcriptional regulator [Brachyspira sp.]HIS36770.1 helix-turn-helix transcriptional regulator [Candidatus Scatousia excrementigallinarum]